MILSILICTLPERRHFLERMMGYLNPQIGTDHVEVIVDDRPRGITTGEKRNDLIAKARGKHFCFIDDDDWVASTYVNDIVTNIQAYDPDVITFKGWMTTNGAARVDWIIKLGEKYEARKDFDNVTRYYRFPNHLCAMRRDLVKGFKFDHIWQGEDYNWAKKIHDAKVLKTEIHIDRLLYHYQFITGK